MRDMVRKGRHGRAKMTPELVRQLRAEHAESGLSYKALGAKYGVSDWTVGGIIRGESWTSIE